jgi:Flp pilus assembly protein TadD
LIDRAGEARRLGDYEQALAYLERAQRIEPGDAEIYLGLAQTHAAAGNSGQARATAERGLLYCSGRVQCDALRAYTR